MSSYIVIIYMDLWLPDGRDLVRLFYALLYFDLLFYST